MGDFFKHATNPKQYDGGNLTWQKEGLKESPVRSFFYEHLEPELDVNGKSVLDVGSGMGPLFDVVKKHGAVEVVGVEPSSQNLKVSRELHPNIKIISTAFESAVIHTQFDVVVAIMVFEHIGDIEKALEKIRLILVPGGRFYLIAADRDYFRESRSGYQVDSEQVDEHTHAVRTVREGTGTMYDLVRPVDWYIRTAKKVGLELEKHIGLRPTENLIRMASRYAVFKERNIFHLLIFRST